MQNLLQHLLSLRVLRCIRNRRKKNHFWIMSMRNLSTSRKHLYSSQPSVSGQSCHSHGSQGLVWVSCSFCLCHSSGWTLQLCLIANNFLDTYNGWCKVSMPDVSPGVAQMKKDKATWMKCREPSLGCCEDPDSLPAASGIKTPPWH